MAQPLPSLFIIFMGSLDCLTTVIGTSFYGTQELNPLVAGLVNSDILGFVILKLTVTMFVGLIFILAEKSIVNSGANDYRSIKVAHQMLKAAYIGIALFLAVVVLNNIFVLLRVLW